MRYTRASCCCYFLFWSGFQSVIFHPCILMDSVYANSLVQPGNSTNHTDFRLNIDGQHRKRVFFLFIESTNVIYHKPYDILLDDVPLNSRARPFFPLSSIATQWFCNENAALFVEPKFGSSVVSSVIHTYPNYTKMANIESQKKTVVVVFAFNMI